MNEAEVTVRGNVISDVKQVTFSDGNVLTSFRVACNVRRWDGTGKSWIDHYTNFFTVNCRRGLGANAMHCLAKGNPVVVRGRLRQQRWSKEGRNGETCLIDADAIGHDLNFGVSAFEKVARVEKVVDNAEAASQDLTAELIAAELAGRDGTGPLVDPRTGELLEDDFDATAWANQESEDDVEGTRAAVPA